MEDHFVGFEEVQFTAAVPIDRLGDSLNQRSQLLLVIRSDLLTRGLTLGLGAVRVDADDMVDLACQHGHAVPSSVEPMSVGTGLDAATAAGL